MGEQELLDYLHAGGDLSLLSDEDFQRLGAIMGQGSREPQPSATVNPAYRDSEPDPLFSLMPQNPNNRPINFSSPNTPTARDIGRMGLDIAQIGGSFLPVGGALGASLRVLLGAGLGAGQGALEAPPGEEWEGARDRALGEGALSAFGEGAPAALKELGLQVGTRLAKLPERFATREGRTRLRQAFREADVPLGDTRRVQAQRRALNPQLQAAEDSIPGTTNITEILPFASDQLQRAAIATHPETTTANIGRFWAGHIDEQSRRLGRTPLPEGAALPGSAPSGQLALPSGTPDEITRALQAPETALTTTPSANRPLYRPDQPMRTDQLERVGDVPLLEGELVDEALPAGTILDAGGRPTGGPQLAPEGPPRRFEATAREMGEMGRGARSEARTRMQAADQLGLESAAIGTTAQSSEAIGKAYQALVKAAAESHDPALRKLLDQLNRQLSNTYLIEQSAPAFRFRLGQAGIGGGLGAGVGWNIGGPAGAAVGGPLGVLAGSPGLASRTTRAAAGTAHLVPPLVRTKEAEQDIDTEALLQALQQLMGNQR